MLCTYFYLYFTLQKLILVKKLNGATLNYLIYDKEQYALVKALET